MLIDVGGCALVWPDQIGLETGSCLVDDGIGDAMLLPVRLVLPDLEKGAFFCNVLVVLRGRYRSVPQLEPCESSLVFCGSTELIWEVLGR